MTPPSSIQARLFAALPGAIARRLPENPSINTTVTSAVAFDPNSLWVSPILPCHKSNCHQLVGAGVYDTAVWPLTAQVSSLLSTSSPTQMPGEQTTRHRPSEPGSSSR